ncbi:translation factor Sua5 [Ignicoccus pacificus DSM 13166]|uniref:L-threonylcarbamoyladenylate synthase n=1 Tax=Ignicoccus pacificus DSM 13166 TaxID=940294 RepID=A0A977PKA8_9CREN|nr:translation factor Sua5 [Ignicoccus pacificus DSM 13166]
MRVLKLSEVGLEEALREAKEVLERGGLVIVPTETVYGIASKLEHAWKIYEIKKRPKSKPLPVQASLEDLEKVAYLDERAKALAKRFWPGPLTMVLKAKPTVPEFVTAGTGKVGLRVPAHPFTLRLLKEVGPLAVTSANISGGRSPKRIEEVTVEADLAIDAGPCELGQASTVIDLTGKEIKVLREGPISLKEILLVLKSVL